MKKSELEEAYKELQYRYDKLQSDSRAEIEKLEFFRSVERKNAIADLEDKAYEKWKELNGAFMKRFIGDLITQNELQFSFNSGYNGYFDMKIYMGNNLLTSVNGEICMNENSLEW